MVKRVQVPVVGGLRKVVSVAQNTGTTIAGLDGQTITLSNLAALIARQLGISPTFAQPVPQNVNTSTTGVNITINSHPVPATVVDDEFEFGSVLDTTGARFTSANPWNKLNTYMTNVNLTMSVANGALTATLRGNPATAGATSASMFGYAGWYQPIQGPGPWSYTMRVKGLNVPFDTGVPTYPGIGLFVATSASGSAVFFLMGNDGGGLVVAQVITSSLATNTSGSVIITGSLGNPGWAPNINTWDQRLSIPEIYIQIHTSGSNLVVFSFSPTGYPGTFQDCHLLTTYWNLNTLGLYGITSQTATIVGMCMNVNSSSSSFNSSVTAVVDWFRKTAWESHT